jgi:hypothetical protein
MRAVCFASLPAASGFDQSDVLEQPVRILYLTLLHVFRDMSERCSTQ